VKVSPNQQLILANEYRAPAKNGPPLEDVIGVAAQGATLRRLTMIASRPDATTVWVHADYGAGHEAVNDPILVEAAYVDDGAQNQEETTSSALITDARHSSARSLAAVARSQTPRGPAAYYARVQTLGERKKGLYVDVRV
jgi:hypothetical protein